jgi:hypothetical protein
MVTPRRLYVAVGFLLLIAGIVFDFFYLAPKVTLAFKGDASPYLNSFERYIHDLARTYMLVLGLANILLSVFPEQAKASKRLDWASCLMVVFGSLLLVLTAFWYAVSGPSFQWETRCTVLSIALLSLLAGLGLEAYRRYSVGR